MKKSVNPPTQNIKDPENIYMNDIFHILKDQKSKIDSLLRQTRQGLQQSNSRIKGFWNSSSNNSEPSTIPCKILNDIQGYESSAGKINNILHKKVNQLKRISMKKKIYQDIEQREKDKERQIRYSTPQVRINVRSSVDGLPSNKPNNNQQQDTAINTRVGSMQLDAHNPLSQTTEYWVKRKNIPPNSDAHPKQQLIGNIENQSKHISILKRRQNDSARASLDQITQIYSPQSYNNKFNKEKIYGQSMIINPQTENNDLSYINMSMDLQDRSFDKMNMNSERNRAQSYQIEMQIHKDQYIDKENNQQYLLKQVQQQQLKLTQKQNQILHRQLLEQSNQYNFKENIQQIDPLLRNQKGSPKIFQDHQQRGQKEPDVFLPTINIIKKFNNEPEAGEIDYGIREVSEMKKEIKQQKTNHSNQRNIKTQQNEKDRRLDQLNGFESDEFNNEQKRLNLERQSGSLQTPSQIYSSSPNHNFIDQQDKLKLINKYKLEHLNAHNSLSLPHESQIYPLNIMNDRKQDNYHFFKRDSQDSNSLYPNLLNCTDKQNSFPAQVTKSYSIQLNYQKQTNNNFSENQNSSENFKQMHLTQQNINQEDLQLQPGQSIYQQNAQDYNKQNINRKSNESLRKEKDNDIKKKYREMSKEKDDVLKGSQFEQKRNDPRLQNPPFQEIYKNNLRGQEEEEKVRQIQSDLSNSQERGGKSSNEFIQNKMYSPPPSNRCSSQQYSQIPHQPPSKQPQPLPFQTHFSIKKTDLKLDLSKIVNQQSSQNKYMSHQKENEYIHQSNSQPFISTFNEKINEDLKEKLQHNFLSRLGLQGGLVLQKNDKIDQKSKNNQIISPNSPKSMQNKGMKELEMKNQNKNLPYSSYENSSKVKFNDPNLFNYHKLIGCANLDEKNKNAEYYQHYHSNQREKQEVKYYEKLNEKLNYQIEINLLFLQQSLLKSKSQTKKQLLEKLQAFREEIVEASQSQESSIQNLKKSYKHLYTFNLPSSIFVN